MPQELRELTNIWESQTRELLILIHYIIILDRHLEGVEAEVKGTYPTLLPEGPYWRINELN